MKYMTIIILILLMQTSASFMNAIEYTASFNVAPYQEGLDLVSKDTIAQGEYAGSPAAFDANDFGLWEVVKGLSTFVSQFAWGIIAVPYTLKNFGLDSTLAYILSGPVYLVYLIALVQIIANKGFKTMN